MKNLILIFLIIMFSVSSVHADTENRIRKINIIKHMKKHNSDKRFFRHAPAATVRKHGERVLSRQIHYKRKPIVQDDANIYFISGDIALATIAYLTPKEVWQYVFIRVRSHNYIIGIQIKF